MTDTALLLKEIEELPQDYLIRVFDFVEQLKQSAHVKEREPKEAVCSADMFDQAARLIGYKDHLDYLRANTPKTIEEAKAEAKRKFNDRKGESFFDRFYGILEGDDTYGDGMEYQKKMRSEWPD
ncbi:hypothetical protein FACS1894200_11000 [Spirochaetia bacterium]|nr:hypothetical protein FACS1894200_11000 [Spirochaetia bacterium]